MQDHLKFQTIKKEKKLLKGITLTVSKFLIYIQLNKFLYTQ